MPTYDYQCDVCKRQEERMVPLAGRDKQECRTCGDPLKRLLAAPLGRIAGRVVQGGGADRFVADQLGIPLKELPPGLKTPVPRG